MSASEIDVSMNYSANLEVFFRSKALAVLPLFSGQERRVDRMYFADHVFELGRELCELLQQLGECRIKRRAGTRLGHAAGLRREIVEDVLDRNVDLNPLDRDPV